MAWWRVEYNGLVGWTTEGKDAEYWTEPLVPAVLPSPIPLNSATPPTTSKLAQPREVINRGNFYRMTPLAELGEKCVISDVRAFSADSTFFACVNIVDSTIHIWNVKTGEEVRVIREFYEEVFDIVANFSLSFSPIEPEVFALTTRDNRIYQWNVNTGEHSVLATLQNNLKRLTFSPDGKVVAAQDFSGTITLIDAASGGINATFVTGDEDIFSIVYSSDGTKLAAMNVNGRYWIWDVTSMTLVREGQLQSPRMDMSFRLVYQPNDSFMAAASNEVLLHLWNVDTGEILSIVEGNYAGRKVAFSSDGTFYAAMTAKSNFVMYDTNTHQVIFEYPVNDTYVPDDLGFSPDGTLFVITAIGSPTRLWGVPAGELQG
jgi:WD40 repeat protein